MSYIGKLKVGSTTYEVGSTLLLTCGTAANTAAKTVTSSGFTLETGVTVHVKFTYSNTAANPTLNINSTGAKSIKSYGTTAVGTAEYTSWPAGAVVTLTYDGTNWVMNGGSSSIGTNFATVVVTKSSVSSLPVDIADSKITANHVVVNSVLSNPSAQTGDWTVTTTAGNANVSGTISGTTDITLYLNIQA